MYSSQIHRSVEELPEVCRLASSSARYWPRVHTDTHRRVLGRALSHPGRGHEGIKRFLADRYRETKFREISLRGLL